MKRQLGIVAAFAGIAIAGCSSSSSGGASPQPTVTVTSTQPFEPTVSTTPAATPSSGARNLFLTQEIRQQLVEAKAEETRLRPGAYTGLYKGSAYYAIDYTTGIYWAGASVIPSHHSIRAEVNSQDEGGYNIFVLLPGSRTWKVYDAGRDGPEARSGAQCPVKIPADVLNVWHWAPNTCDPPLSTLGN